MNNTMIYPFDSNSIELVRYNDLIENYNFVSLVSPNGWGFTGKDASCVDNSECLGIIVENNFDKGLESCDTVLFVKSDKELDFNNIIYPKIIKAAESSKNIVCSISINNQIRDRIQGICNNNNKFFKYIVDNDKDIKEPLSEKLLAINVPIVLVAGLCERTNKFGVQLSIRKNLINMGYKVSQIGTKNYCELMGFHSFPQFMLDKKFYDWEKIVLFNYYIKRIEIDENPDIIVIGIPGSTLPFTERIPNKFGVLAYKISQAVTPDFTILCSLYKGGLSKEYFKSISEIHENKFNYSIDCFNISNQMYNANYSEHLEKIHYVTLDWRFVSEEIQNYKEMDTPIYNILDKDNGRKLTEFLVDKLSGYVDQ